MATQKKEFKSTGRPSGKKDRGEKESEENQSERAGGHVLWEKALQARNTSGLAGRYRARSR